MPSGWPGRKGGFTTTCSVAVVFETTVVLSQWIINPDPGSALLLHPTEPDRQARPAIANPAMPRSSHRRDCAAGFLFTSSPPLPQGVPAGISILPSRLQENIHPSR